MAKIIGDRKDTKALIEKMANIYAKQFIKMSKDYNHKGPNQYKDKHLNVVLTTLIEKNREAIDIIKISQKLLKKEIYANIQESKGMKSVDISKMVRKFK